jgi:hypothetical protein
MTIVFIFKSGKVSKVTVNNQQDDILQKIKSFFSQEYTDDDRNRYLIIEDDNGSRNFFVNLSDVSAIEIVKQNKKVKQ